MAGEMSDFEKACQEWAQRWIEDRGTQWCDPRGQDLHIELARELARQMKWAWLTGQLQGTDGVMSCGYSRERIRRNWDERLTYPHVAADPWGHSDLHLAPHDWKP